MTHKPLSIQLLSHGPKQKLTAHGGALLYLDLIHKSGLLQAFKKQSPKCSHSARHHWNDLHYMLLLLLLNLLGGDTVSAFSIIAEDRPIVEAFHHCVNRYLPCKARRYKDLPSHSSFLRYLKAQSEDSIDQLWACNKQLLSFMQTLTPFGTATLDLDATLIPTHKKEAQYCYQKHKAYQPLNLYWAEQQAVVHSEFKDGNVSAAAGLKDMLVAGIQCLPKTVKTVYLRADSAAYQAGLMTHCIDNKIGFTISGRISKAIREDARGLPQDSWKILRDEHGVETGEYTPIAHPSDAMPASVRYLLIRRRCSGQAELDLGAEPESSRQVVIGEHRYRLSVVVTNRALADDEVIRWHYKRCGYSEDLHRALKHDLAGARLPCGHFQANALWWLCACSSYQLHSLMQRFMQTPELKKARIKTLRFYIIQQPARWITHARGVALAFCQATFKRLSTLRDAILAAADPPLCPL